LKTLETRPQDFEIVEPTLALRGVLLGILDNTSTPTQDGNTSLATNAQAQSLYFINVAQAARKAKSFQVASNALHTASQLQQSIAAQIDSRIVELNSNLPIATAEEVTLEQSKLLWSKGDSTNAISLASSLLRSIKTKNKSPTLTFVSFITIRIFPFFFFFN